MGKVTELPKNRNGDPDAGPEDQAAIDAVNSGADGDLGEGVGQSLEDLAGQDEGQQQFLDFGDSLNLTFKGKKPTDSELKIKAISRPIKGQLGDKGDDEIYTFIVRGRLDKDEVVRKRDGDGRVTAKTRRAVLTPISMSLIDEAKLAEILD